MQLGKGQILATQQNKIIGSITLQLVISTIELMTASKRQCQSKSKPIRRN